MVKWGTPVKHMSLTDQALARSPEAQLGGWLRMPGVDPPHSPRRALHTTSAAYYSPLVRGGPLGPCPTPGGSYSPREYNDDNSSLFGYVSPASTVYNDRAVCPLATHARFVNAHVSPW